MTNDEVLENICKRYNLDPNKFVYKSGLENPGPKSLESLEKKVIRKIEIESF